MWKRAKNWARTVRRDTVSLYLAARDERTPWYAKALAAVVVGYAVSPIDLIPDFIPVIGYLDDILLVPLGLWLVRRLIPAEVMEDCRSRAVELEQRPSGWIAAVVVVMIWITAAALTAWFVYRAVPA
jgi:uncharacterized membrane protein YkvA (DUF1232 family)